jgi:DNA relaxase NicK
MIDIIRAQAAEQAARLHKDLQLHLSEQLPVLVRPPLTNRGGHVDNCAPVDNFGPVTAQRTKLDWYGFTVVRDFRDLEAWVDCVFPGAVVTPHPKGIKGYPESAGIYLNDALLGSIGYGASHGRNMVNLTGEGCKRISAADYGFLIECTQALNGDFERDAALAIRDQVKLIRIDLAHDFYRGELTWEDADQAFDEGMFDSLHPITGEVLSPVKGVISGKKKGVNLGRTLNAGLRSSPVMCRVYEKGLEVFAKMPEDYKATQQQPGDAILGPDQFAPSETVARDWLRVECEFKPKDGAVITWDLITERDRFFAGAFPFTALCLEYSGGQKVERVRDTAIVTLDRTLKAFRHSYGPTVNTLRGFGLTDTQILDMIDTGQPNGKLLRAGVRDAVTNDPLWRAMLGAGDLV